MACVLVVDDEPDLRFLHRRVLERAGHQVIEAGDGAAAWQKVREVEPDLVLTDIMMPVMNGVELIERSAEIGNSPWTPTWCSPSL